ncbi:MAG: transcriptional repressor NrdR, partial [Halobacteriovoraceae bacterium]|nr:transcriptional repressor NrdR [Halobacteriovoraceae bacterium]
KVIDSRSLQEGLSIRRRRKCPICSSRFTTYESYLVDIPELIKNDGRREAFKRDKLRKGIAKACQKRSISTAEIDELLNQVEKFLREFGQKEIVAQKIGEKVMQLLYQLDPVAYVRYASFYWQFEDIDNFVINLQKNLIEQRKHKNLQELQLDQ